MVFICLCRVSSTSSRMLMCKWWPWNIKTNATLRASADESNSAAAIAPDATLGVCSCAAWCQRLMGSCIRGTARYYYLLHSQSSSWFLRFGWGNRMLPQSMAQICRCSTPLSGEKGLAQELGRTWNCVSQPISRLSSTTKNMGPAKCDPFLSATFE